MKTITATDLYNYHKCKYRVYMDKNTDSSKKDEISYFLELLWENGRAHEGDAIEYFKSQDKKTFEEVSGELNDEEEVKKAARETLMHMKSGVDFIYQGVLVREGEDSLFEQSPMLVGRPDILVKIGEKSALGEYSYAPLDIKSGKGKDETDWGERFNLSYMAQLNFYGLLLEDITKTKIHDGYIFNVHQKFVKYPLSYNEPAFGKILGEIKKMTGGSTENREPVISSVCGLCHWQSICQKQAEESKDLTLLFYLGEKVKYGFYEIGIKSISELADSRVADVISKVHSGKRNGLFYPSFSDELVKSLIKRAQIRESSEKTENELTYEIRTKPSFPETSKEIHYDIEDDPMSEHVYMHGFWIIEKGKEPYYHALVATRDKTEKTVTEELWQFFNDNKGVPIYHYSAHEKHTCKKLMNKYNLEQGIFNDVFGSNGSAIDLYEWVIAHTDWPLTSYGLKPICKYTGFAWSADDAGGANSISWYYDYLDGKDEMMDKIRTYNKEDCMATAHLKQWLLEHC